LRKLNIGIIGCGAIARIHAAKLKNIKGVQIIAFSDIAIEKTKPFLEKYGGRKYQDWRKMLKKEKLDAVYVCIPPYAHTNEVMLAAEKGINVFIEKPIALNMNLARNMVKAVEKGGVKSQVGYCCRFGYAIDEAKRLIQSGEAGEVGLVLGWYLCHFLGEKWWRNKEKSGGQIVEQATHLYDAISYLCGELEETYGQMNKKFWIDIPDLTIEDVSSTTFKFKSGTIGSIVATTWGPLAQWWFRWLLVTKNFTLFSENRDSLTLYSANKAGKAKTGHEERDIYLLENEDFIQAVLQDKETKIPIQEGFRTLEFTIASRISMEQGKPIRFPLT
jgi:predicted dehydrogenase